MPVIPNKGIPIIPQFVKKDIEDSYGSCNFKQIQKYKRYSLNSARLKAGRYDEDDFSEIVENQLNKVTKTKFDWNRRRR